MSNNVMKMTDAQLRNEVQLLRDELAIMKRKYEDIIYNLDTENFSSRFVKEQGDMRTAIEVTAEGIKTKVSREEVKGLFESEIKQTADEIYAVVSENYDDLDSQISSVSVRANGISTRVSNLETFKTSVFTQTADGFTLDGEKTTFTGVVYLTDEDDNKRYSLFYTDSRGFEEVFLHSCTTNHIPLVIGDSDGNVYVGWNQVGNEVATRSWVLANAGSGAGSGSGGSVVAVFG